MMKIVQMEVILFVIFLDLVFSSPLRPSLHHARSDFESFPDLGTLFEGDILLPSERNAVMSDQYKWPSGTVPYEFDPAYTMLEKEKVVSAMRDLESKTCVKFIPRTNQEEYIEIGKRPELGCAAMVGYHRGLGHGQLVNYRAPECLQKSGVIQHELLHVLGLLHEQSRPDRDQHVQVLWENIHEAYWNDFKKAPEKHVTTYGVPYDYKSIMHYPNNAFSKNGNDTIIAKKDPSMVLGQREHPTESDLEKVRRIYQCTSLPTTYINKLLNFV